MTATITQSGDGAAATTLGTEYLPGVLVDWLSAGPTGEHRVVDGTVVLADVSGFTALTERLARSGQIGAEETNDLLSEVFSGLLEVVAEHGGRLVKWCGDAVLLLFDGPFHAARACRASWDMRAAMGTLGQIRTSSGRARLRLSVGVHSGPVDLYLVGDSHRELIAVGPAAGAVVRAQSFAPTGEIAVSEATAALLEPGTTDDAGLVRRRPAEHPGPALPRQAALQGEASLPRHAELRRQGALQGEASLARQGPLQGDALVPRHAELPRQGAHPGEASLPRQAELPRQGAHPGEASLPRQAELPRQEVAFPAAPYLSTELRARRRAGDTGSEHRLVAVAFLEFAGVDTMHDREGPAEVLAAVDAVVRRAQAACDRYHVTFLETDISEHGGRIMMVAGAPRRYGRDTERLLRAVHEVMDGGGALPLRAGVNAGRVFTGDLGPAWQRTYSVKGDAVNLAARVMQHAAPGQLLVTATALESGHAMRVESVPEFAVKGKVAPVQAFSVLGPDHLEPPAATDASATPWHGRESELARLEDLLTLARAGHGRTVMLEGPPGIGKSRLVAEFLARVGASASAAGRGGSSPAAVARKAGPTAVAGDIAAPTANRDGASRTEPPTVLQVGCNTAVAGAAYALSERLLRAALSVPADATPQQAADMLAAAVRLRAPDLAVWLPLLATVLRADWPMTDEVAALAVEFRKARLEQLLVAVLAAVLPGPTIMVVDDIHLADPASTDALNRLAQGIDARPWLMLWCGTDRRKDPATAARADAHADAHPDAHADAHPDSSAEPPADDRAHTDLPTDSNPELPTDAGTHLTAETTDATDVPTDDRAHTDLPTDSNPELPTDTGTHLTAETTDATDATTPSDSDGPPIVRLTLGGLAPADIAALLSEQVTGSALLPHQRAAIAARAEGNPLFLHELARLVGRTTTTTDLPDSVEGLLAAEVDQLDPADRFLLRASAVSGMHVEPELVAQALGEAVRDERWARLASFLEPDAGGTLRFRHGLIREAAYQGLPHRSRRQLHLALGLALQRRAGSNPDAQAERLSAHFFAAGDYASAAHYAQVAGERAAAVYANPEASTLLVRAWDAARRRRPRAPEEIARLAEMCGDIYYRLGDFAAAGAAFAAARPLLRRDTVGLARLCLKSSQVVARTGGFPRALAWITRGRRLLAGADDPQAIRQDARLLVQIALLRQMEGRPDDAERACELAIAATRRTSADDVLGQALQLRDAADVARGRFDGEPWAEQALQIWQQRGDLGWQARVLNQLGIRAYFTGRWDDALQHYQRAASAFSRVGDEFNAAIAACNVAEILSDQGHQQRAAQMAQDAQEVLHASGALSETAFARSVLGRAAQRDGRFADAREHLQAARSAYTRAGERGEIAATDLRLAECSLGEGRPVEALGEADRIAAQAADPALRGAAARLRGQALAVIGDAAAARAALREALDLARQNASRYDELLALDALIDLDARSGPNPTDGTGEAHGIDEDGVAARTALAERLGVVTVQGLPVSGPVPAIPATVPGRSVCGGQVVRT